MTLSISYPEISDILKQKTGKEVALSFKSVDTITAIYTASVEIPGLTVPVLKIPICGKKKVSKNLSVDLQILEFKDNQLIVRIEAGLAGNLAIKVAQFFLEANIPLTVYPGATDARTFLLDLRDIEQLKPVLKQMNINSVGLFPEEIRIDAAIKP